MKTLCAITLWLALSAAPLRAGLFPVNAFTDSARGLAGAQFLKAPPSARSAALAGGGLTLSGPDLFLLEPAAAAAARMDSLSVSYESLLLGSSRTGMVFSVPSSAGTFSAGLVYNDYTPGLEPVDGAAQATGAHDITAYDMAAAAGWARRFGWVDAGLDVKYIKSRLAEASGSTAALDAGVRIRRPVPSNTEFGLAVRNLGAPLKLGSESAPLPFELGAGLKWKYAPDFDILAEGRLPCDHAPYLLFAGELFLPYSGASGFFLRSGLNFRNYSDQGIMGAFTGGFGFRSGGFTLDYAFVPYGDLGSTHRVSAALFWGGAPSNGGTPPARLSGEGGRLPLLAVAPFTAEDGVSGTEAAVIRSLVESELTGTGRFRAANRDKLDFILEEKKLAYAGLSEERSAEELARSAGADLAVFGSVGRDGKGYRITVSISDARTGKVLRSGTESAAEDYLFRDAARRLAAGFLD